MRKCIKGVQHQEGGEPLVFGSKGTPACTPAIRTLSEELGVTCWVTQLPLGHTSPKSSSCVFREQWLTPVCSSLLFPGPLMMLAVRKAAELVPSLPPSSAQDCQGPMPQSWLSQMPLASSKPFSQLADLRKCLTHSAGRLSTATPFGWKNFWKNGSCVVITYLKCEHDNSYTLSSATKLFIQCFICTCLLNYYPVSMFCDYSHFVDGKIEAVNT